MIAANRIRWNKVVSNELNVPDLIMDVAFDSDDSETETYLNREAVSQESYDGRRHHVTFYKYNERFSPKFTFVKKGFGDFSAHELRSVLKWLTSLDTPSLIDVYYDDSEVIEWSAIGNWTEINSYKLANNRTVGIVATFEAAHPFALSDLYTVTKTIIPGSDDKIIIKIDTDDNKPVYPRITIQETDTVIRVPYETVYDASSDIVENTVYFNGRTYYWKSAEKTSSTTRPNYDWDIIEVDKDYTDEDLIEKNKIYYYKKSEMYYWIDPHYFHSSAENPNLSTTSVKLTNTHTDFLNQPTVLNSTIVKNNNGTEFITLDGANKIVASNSVNRIFGDDFNWKWLELYDGTNEITVEGNCDIQIEYRTIKKLGEY